MTFEGSAYVLAGFLTVFGILFLWLSYKSPKPDKKGLGVMIQGKVSFMLFALLYLSLAHFSVYSGVAYSIEYAENPVCEYQVANATVSGNVTSYEYLNPCASLSVPTGTTNLLYVMTWLFVIDALALVFGAMILFARLMSEW